MDCDGPSKEELLATGLQLIRQGLPIFPVGADKKPFLKWRKGERDFVVNPISTSEWEGFANRPHTRGIAVLGSLEAGSATLDIEKAGLDNSDIRDALSLLPDHCKQDSRNGGQHAYLIIDDDHPGRASKLAFDPPPEDGGEPVLLAELRGHASYAVIVGPGRPSLPAEFAPARISRSEYDKIESRIRLAGKYTPEPPKFSQEYRHRGQGGGTGDIITDALKARALSPLAVLPTGWKIAGFDQQRRIYVRRPGASSEQSGNVLDGVVTVFSSAVEWVDSGTAISGAECLARSRHEGDFAAAMRWVEEAARLWKTGHGTVPEHWNEQVFQAVLDACDSRSVEGLQEGANRSVAMGRRMANDWHRRFMFVPGLGWFEWCTYKWTSVSDEVMMSEAASWAETHIIHLIATRASRSEIDQALRYRDIGHVRSLLQGAKTSPEILVDVSKLDQHPTLLNCPNGVVDLTTGRLSPSNPDLLMTKATSVDYVPGALDNDWSHALEALDEESRTYLQLRLGQSLYGSPPPGDEVVLCDGGGENGKTSLLATARAAIGDYGVVVSERVLMGSADQHPTEFMDFRGARLAYMEETPEARRLDVIRLKRIVGTPRIKARRISKDPVEFDVTHSLFISTNYLPNVNEVDHGTWRRLLRVPFPYTFRKPGQPLVGPLDRHGVPGLRERLLTPASWGQRAALAWMVQGAADFHARGGQFPPPPQGVAAATEEWRAESDLVMRYCQERLVFDPSSCVLSEDLLEDFNGWLTDQHHHPYTAAMLSSRFGQHFLTSTHGVTKQETRRLDGLSRPADTWRPVREKATVWRGVKFLGPSDAYVEDVEDE